MHIPTYQNVFEIHLHRPIYVLIINRMQLYLWYANELEQLMLYLMHLSYP